MKLSALYIFLFILVSIGLCSCVNTLEGFHEERKRSRRHNKKGKCNKKNCRKCKNMQNMTLNADSTNVMETYTESVDNNGTMGVTQSMIPKGDEDLYVLKSQIVPPVCPACPSSCPPEKKNSSCPPCPPCARCPEPSFDCKKVPNYASAQKNNVVPRAVLSDFSTFGM